jgi:signal transduction histidine kinase
MKLPVRVLVVEDNRNWATDLCDDLKVKLGPNDPDGPGWQMDFKIVGDQESANRALDDPTAADYDLVLLDLAYPQTPSTEGSPAPLDPRQGMNWLRDLRKRLPRATILIVSAHVEDFEVPELVQAVRHGFADDFVNKNAGIREIATRIQVAHENSRHRHQAADMAKEYYTILRSFSWRIYAEDIGQLLQETQRRLESVAVQIEHDDPSAIVSAPSQIRTSIHSARAGFEKLSSLLLLNKEMRKNVDLAEVVRGVLLLYEIQADDNCVDFTGSYQDAHVHLTTYASDIKFAVHEVVRNALDAVTCPGRTGQPRGTVHIKVEPKKDGAEVVVRDNGGGFDSAILNHLYQPGNTNRPRDTYMGIGLYIARRILQAIGGDIQCRNLEDKQGAEVVLTVRDLR